MKSLLWKLLRKHVSGVQLGGFALANLVGLSIVAIAMQFYLDLSPIFNDEDSFVRSDYLVVSRRVTGVDALLGGNTAFNDKAIADIESQPWVRRVGRFTTSSYDVRASVAIGSSGASMSTKLFFESIPAEFIDINPSEWHFNAAKPEIPVIISKDYLSLYNFGFAAAQGMPKISEGMAGMIPLQFTISGGGRQGTFKGHIVGFSNRINTILVPDEFMQWSNDKFGNGEKPAASRIIVEVSAPGDIKIEQYMKDHHLEVAGDKNNSSKASYLFTIAVSVVAAVGIVISILAFFVLTLSIMLLLQKNSKKLQDLLMLGYNTRQVSMPYIKMVLAINCAVLVLGIALMLVARSIYLPMLQSLNLEGASPLPTVICAALIIACITLGNCLAITRRVSSLWHQ